MRCVEPDSDAMIKKKLNAAREANLKIITEEIASDKSRLEAKAHTAEQRKDEPEWRQKQHRQEIAGIKEALLHLLAAQKNVSAPNNR
jgi:hypothetical protein